VVWHLSLPLMNSFNKTEAAIFMQAMLLGAFISLIVTILRYIQFLKLSLCYFLPTSYWLLCSLQVLRLSTTIMRLKEQPHPV